MKLIKGINLTQKQKQEVLSAFVYRNTIENPCTIANKICEGSDEQWIKSRAFYITKKGRLAYKPGHCEPEYLAE